jgi:hypothetical protein
VSLDGYLFDFPGRAFVLAHPDASRATTLRAIAALAPLVTPTVVEVSIDDGLPVRIAGADFDAWLRDVPTEARLYVAIDDGWFPVNARAGERLRLGSEIGTVLVPVEEREGGAAVRDRSGTMVTPPVGIVIDESAGRLTFRVHASSWLDVGGVGHAAFAAVNSALARDGWVIERAPSADELDWRTWSSPRAVDAPAARAVAAPLPTVTPGEIEWVALPDADVIVGIDERALDRLVDALVAMDRAYDDDDVSLGLKPDYDPSRRAHEVREALTTSRGTRIERVAGVEIAKRPVSNAMWSAYAAATGARDVTNGRPPESAVSGVSWIEASAFAAHHGGSLPSEAEWQLAASGSVSRFFPWGDEPRIDAPWTSTLGVERIASGAELTRDAWRASPDAPPVEGAICARGETARAGSFIAARRAIARDAARRFVVFRIVRARR